MSDEGKFQISKKSPTFLDDIFRDYVDVDSGITSLYEPSYHIPTNGPWYNNPGNWTIRVNDTYSNIRTNPVVTRFDNEVVVTTDDGSNQSISRDELLKYISERKLIQENELVRKVYERFQVALKLARSDDDGDTGV